MTPAMAAMAIVRGIRVIAYPLAIRATHPNGGNGASQPMTAPQIKICGLTTADTLEAAIRARADYAGFVFYPPSPRFVAPRDAAVLAERASGRIDCVGLFVDA